MSKKVRIKSNKGSSLIMTILIIFIMTTLGMAIMMVTLSEFQMSKLSGDLNRSYFFAEAGIDHIAKALDEQIARIQEQAKKDALNSVSTDDYTSKTDGTFDSVSYYAAVETEYKRLFNDYVTAAFADANTNVDTRVKILGDSDAGKFNENGTDYAYAPMPGGEGRIIINSAEFKSENVAGKTLNSLKVYLRGNSGGLNKIVSATFKLLNEPKTGTIPYKIAAKQVVKPSTLPDIFKKAVVAEKNIIAASGNVKLDGDVLCFGTIPVDETTHEENQYADWNEYGGIMAGMSDDFYNKLGSFEIDPSNINTPPLNASLQITGNAATMSSIHTLYGNSSKASSIEIDGNVYARSIRTEPDANYSKITLNSLIDPVNNKYSETCVLDNLQMDAFSDSRVTINGNYYGVVDSGATIQGPAKETYDEGLDDYQFKRTSSIVVNGDSILNLKGQVYVGGSAFFMDYKDSQGHPYMSGISAQKSTTLIPDAFTYGSGVDGLYCHKGDIIDKDKSPLTAKYYFDNFGDIIEKQMLNGKTGSTKFALQDRAKHFKLLWEQEWSGSVSKKANINYGLNININPSSKQVYGYSGGALIADGTVYGPNDILPPPGVSLMDTNNFHLFVRDVKLEEFHNAIQDFLEKSYSDDHGKLTYVKPDDKKTLFGDGGYIDRKYASDKDSSGTIAKDKLYQVSQKGFVYYGSKDIEIKVSGSTVSIGPKGETVQETVSSDCLKNCVILSERNIYVNGGVSLNGVLLATDNVVFQGNGNTQVICDSNTQSRIFDLMMSDTRFMGLFKLAKFELPASQQIETQRLETKNIEIINWKEEK